MKHIHSHGSTKANQNLAKSAINWYVSKYLPNIRKIDIKLQFSNLEETLRGRCTQNSKREYLIEINETLHKDEMISTVMHEMIHVKQYVLNEMSDMNNGSVRWKKQVINPENIDYAEHPWEKEAFAYEGILACVFEVDMGI